MLLFEFQQPDKYLLAVAKFPPAVQLVPSYSSVAAVAGVTRIDHQKLILLFEFLHLLIYLLAVPKLPPVLSKLHHHILLLQLSAGGPVKSIHQNLILLFVFQLPAKAFLAVPKLPPAVQAEPSYSSAFEPMVAGVLQYTHQKLKLLFEFLHLLKHSCCIIISTSCPRPACLHHRLLKY
jgi:hypothetical protein